MGKIFLRALAFVGMMLLAPIAVAQTAGGPIQVRTGDVFTVSVDYTQTSEIGEQSVDARLGLSYSITVLDAEQRIWRFMPVDVSYELPTGMGLEDVSASVNWRAVSDALSAFMRIATDVGFDCRVDEYGRCIEMINWPFWAARVENMVLIADAVARMAPGQEAVEGPKQPGEAGAAPNWGTLREPVLQGVSRLIDAYDSRDAGASLAGIYMPAFVQGRTLTRRQNVPVADEYDMPWGAPPLRVAGTIRLERIDQRNNTATVTRRVALEEESARAALHSMTRFVTDNLITPLAPYFPEGEEPPTAEALIEMLDTALGGLTYQETTTGVIDLATGLARETTTDYVVTITTGEGEAATPITSRGRIVTRVTASAPTVPRLPRR